MFVQSIWTLLGGGLFNESMAEEEEEEKKSKRLGNWEFRVQCSQEETRTRREDEKTHANKLI